MHDDKFTKGDRGEFRGDFSRDTFDPLRHFSRVLMQQGRVQLDADWNEQVSILMHYLRMLTVDLMGPHGTPFTAVLSQKEDFKICPGKNESTFYIGRGHYYVKGILCENDILNKKKCRKIALNDLNAPPFKRSSDKPIKHPDKLENKVLSYKLQPDYPLTKDEREKKFDPGDYLVYLDVWERHLSYVEDDYMREKALGGPDTTSRAKVVWQVKVKELPGGEITRSTSYAKFLDAISDEMRPGSGCLKARAKSSSEDDQNPCVVPLESRYRGAENQLYRVEIHKSSKEKEEVGPTFKWSRENGSVIFPITKVEVIDKKITLEHLGRDNRFGLKPNDWVEIVDDDYILRNRAYALMQILEVDQENLQVILKDKLEPLVGTDRNKHPYLRRWDQTEGDSNGMPVKEADQESDWILLENGVQIQFQPPVTGNKSHVYQTGDYWLIPARTATGDVEWPGSESNPDSLPSQGVEHHYAPLAIVNINDKRTVKVKTDLRRKPNIEW